MRRSESGKDIENVEAWAEVIKRLLDLVPAERRNKVLALVVENHEAEHKKLEAATDSLGLVSYNAADVDWMASPGTRHSHAIARLTSLVIQVFTREITNNHSPEDAAKILFAAHPHGYGSGCLRDYLSRVIDL
jgi:hypothetical protein